MNVFELVWLILFVGGGIAIGDCITAHWLGRVAGGIIGYLALMVLGTLNARDMERSPRCKCGAKDWSHFKVTTEDAWEFVHTSECGIRYVIRKGQLWFEIDEQGKPVLTQIKPFYGDWREPTADEIANKRLRRMP